MFKFFLNQKGIAPVLLLVAAIGVMGIMAIASNAPTGNKLFTTLFPKPPSFAAGAVDLNLTSSSSSVTAGSTFDVGVNINPNALQVSAVVIEVTFDPQKLKANSITGSGLMPVVLSPGTVTSNSASITLGVNPGTSATPVGSLATISFSALQNTGSTTVNFSSATQVAVLGMIGDQKGVVTPLNITINPVSTPTPTPLPSPSVLASASPTPLPSKTPGPTTTPTPTATPRNGSLIKVYAAGTPSDGVFPSLRLQIKNPTSGAWSTVQTFTNVQGNPQNRDFQEFVYTHTVKITPDRLRVRFINDHYNPILGQDRNLAVDRVNIDGVDIQTEKDTVFSQGSWSPDTKCRAGIKKSEWLHCNGFFEYR